MKLSISLFTTLLLASTTLAAPQKNTGLAKRLQRRSRTMRESGNRSKDTTTTSPSSTTNSTSTQSTHASSSSSAIEYSENWSGMAITSPPSGETFNAVSGKITIPTPAIPSGVESTDGEYSASAWVGIDGNTYSTAILQTGVDFTVSTSGVVSYDAWYEWYPDYAYDFDLDISAGDVIAMYVNASTTTSGSATIENLTTGKSVTKDLTSTSALGGENAEWIVEDFEENSELIAFANFGNVTFTECVAATSSSSEGVDSATVMDIENTDDEVLTAVTLISDSSFEVTYTSSSSSSTTSSGAGSSSSGSGGSNGFGSGGMGNGRGFGESVSTSGAGSGKGFPMLKRFLAPIWGRRSTSGGL